MAHNDKVHLLDLYAEFESYKTKKPRIYGKLQIQKQSLKNYKQLKHLLIWFENSSTFKLIVTPAGINNQKHVRAQKKYWESFYDKFTEFLYKDRSHYDNYVGTNIKLLKVFLKWVVTVKGVNIGNQYTQFYVWKEEIRILVLRTEQLNFLIYTKEFRKLLTKTENTALDIFILGCTVALRVSDLFALESSNIEIENDGYYLRVNSKKTNALTMLKLPDFAKEILVNYLKKRGRLFPEMSISHFNKMLKSIAFKAGWTHDVPKTRNRMGKPIVVYKDRTKKIHYRFCDLIGSHTMRRTAITNMLTLGLKEEIVRKISGHAPNSAQFYRYVEYSQHYLDTNTDEMFEKMYQKEHKY